MTSTPTASLASSERGRALTILAAILVMLVVDRLPEPAPIERAGDLIALTPDGKACLAILAFAITLWVTEAVPFAVTALFVLLLVPIFGIADYATTVRAGFGNPLITFFVGCCSSPPASRGRGSARGWCCTCCASSAPAPTGCCSGSW